MRMWMVDPKILCDKHLLGEHGELHKFKPTFEKRYSIAGRYGQIEPKSMALRHDALATEMLRRGMNHKSPFTMPDLSYLPDRDRYGAVDKFESLKLLFERCPNCMKRKELLDENL